MKLTKELLKDPYDFIEFLLYGENFSIEDLNIRESWDIYLECCKDFEVSAYFTIDELIESKEERISYLEQECHSCSGSGCNYCLMCEY